MINGLVEKRISIVRIVVVEESRIKLSGDLVVVYFLICPILGLTRARILLGFSCGAPFRSMEFSRERPWLALEGSLGATLGSSCAALDGTVGFTRGAL